MPITSKTEGSRMSAIRKYSGLLYFQRLIQLATMRTWMTWFTSLWARQKKIERLSASKESTFQTEEIGTEKAHLFTVQIFPAVQGSREESALSPLRQLPLQGSGCNSGQQISPLELIIACNSCVWVGNKCTRERITSNGWKINLTQILHFALFFSLIPLCFLNSNACTFSV